MATRCHSLSLVVPPVVIRCHWLYYSLSPVVSWCQTSRHFSHVTKSRILKNRNFRKKADRNFRGTFLKNLFRHLKLCSNPPS